MACLVACGPYGAAGAAQGRKPKRAAHRCPKPQALCFPMPAFVGGKGKEIGELRWPLRLPSARCEHACPEAGGAGVFDARGRPGMRAANRGCIVVAVGGGGGCCGGDGRLLPDAVGFGYGSGALSARCCASALRSLWFAARCLILMLRLMDRLPRLSNATGWRVEAFVTRCRAFSGAGLALRARGCNLSL